MPRRGQNYFAAHKRISRKLLCLRPSILTSVDMPLVLCVLGRSDNVDNEWATYLRLDNIIGSQHMLIISQTPWYVHKRSEISEV